MLKIGLNARFLTEPFTGIGQYTRHLVRAMAELAPEHDYFLFTPELVDLPLPSNCHQIRVAEKAYQSDSLRKAHWEQILLPAELEKHKIDLAHFLYPSNPNRKLSIPVVVTVHDVIPWRLKEYRKRWRSKLYHLHAKRALKKADHLLTVSDFSKSEIIDLFKIDVQKIAVTPLAPPPVEAELRLPDLPLRRHYFLYVGGFDERKNVPRLMEAFQKHIAPVYPIDLILTGGKHRGLEALIHDRHCKKVADKYRLENKGKIIFTSPLDSHELMGLYQQALALVNVSHYEGFNLPLIEAMSAGIPVITSDLKVHREVTGGHALFVDPMNIDSIGNGLHQLVNDPLMQKELSRQGLSHSKNFSWEKTAKETLYVYDLYT